MTAANRCAGCWAQVYVGDHFQGESVRCPRCGTLVELAYPGDTLHDELEFHGPHAEPCPLCGTGAPQVVRWTPWGSFLGPALFHHVRCRKCGYCYNGRTGRSNLFVAIVFVVSSLALIGGLAILGAALLGL